ncbi:cadmium resistance transporter [Saccharopolyspora hattusasensis]|uniref:cadmium resistance transporter n=1 Tax=Saccharopolyspora hattusasensis TaxID=1128679 RepID=UPI003D984837
MVLAAVVMWAATNIDNLVVSTALFLRSARLGSPRPWQILAGQYLGSTCLIAVSLLAAVGLMIVPESWVGLLGLLPLALGIYGLVGAVRAGKGERDLPTMGVLPVTSIVVANGADNLNVYSAAFRVFPAAQNVLTIVVFLALVGVWCLVAWFATTRKRVLSVLDHVRRWLVPALYMVIGTTILVRTGVLAHIAWLSGIR